MKKNSLKLLLVFPIIALSALLQFCGPAVTRTVAKTAYEEDLSIYRDDNAEEEEISGEDVVTETVEVIERADVEPTHGISAELDSVTSIMIASRANIGVLDGFTIQIYSGNSRDKANELKLAAYEILEETKPTLIYDQPNYKVRVGQYYSRIEANEDFNILKETFSRAVLIPTKIKIETDR